MGIDWISLSIVLVLGMSGLLGFIVSVKPQWVARRSNVLASVFAVLTLAGISLGIIQAARSGQASAALAGSLSDLRRASAEISRVQALNTQLQQRLLVAADRVTELSKQNIGEVTGGDSICYLTFPVFTKAGGLPIVVHRGKFGLYDLQARIVDLRQFERVYARSKPELTIEQYMSSSTMLRIGNLASGSAFSILDRPLPFTDEQPNFRVFFSARNGFWQEDLLLRKVDGQWVRALRVLREFGNRTKPVFEQIEKGFPRGADGKVEWPK